MVARTAFCLRSWQSINREMGEGWKGKDVVRPLAEMTNGNTPVTKKPSFIILLQRSKLMKILRLQ